MKFLIVPCAGRRQIRSLMESHEAQSVADFIEWMQMVYIRPTQKVNRIEVYLLTSSGQATPILSFTHTTKNHQSFWREDAIEFLPVIAGAIIASATRNP